MAAMEQRRRQLIRQMGWQVLLEELVRLAV
jgi:hypothetical protein